MARRRVSGAVTDDIEASKARCKAFVAFIREAWHVLFPTEPYVHGWHIDFMAMHLEAITFGKFLAMGLDNRLLMNVPPGTMKSLILEVFWPAFEWGPCGLDTLQYIFTSFREDFLIRDANRFRKLVTSDWYQARWPISIDKDNEKHIENSRGGWRQCVPFGSLTGGRADRVCIDDPHSIDTAESDADRKRAEMRFTESASLRTNDAVKSAIIVIMQRLHENDISGVILRLKLSYVHVMLPMRFEVARCCVTPLGRDPRTKEGELLFPARFPLATVDRDEKVIGAHATAGQMQQRPGPRGGLMFKLHWFTYVKAAPSDCRLVRGWDLAGSKKKTAAFTAGVLVGFSPTTKKFYIGDVVRDRTENPEVMIHNTATRDGKAVEISIPQDPGAAGLIQSRAIVAKCVGFKITATPESGEKEDRAIPVQSQAEAGNVCIVEGPWNEVFTQELVTFPASAFKDQVDGMSRAFSMFILTPAAPIVGPVVVSTPYSHFGENRG